MLLFLFAKTTTYFIASGGCGWNFPAVYAVTYGSSSSLTDPQPHSSNMYFVNSERDIFFVLFKKLSVFAQDFIVF